MGIGPSSLGDAILFPAPASSYDGDLPGLLWIEEDFSPLPPVGQLSAVQAAEQEKAHRISRGKQRLFPAFFIEAPGGESNSVILYWHGNSCDLGQIYEELDVLSKFLNAHVLAIEFPGYGLAPPLNGSTPEDLAAAASAAALSGGTPDEASLAALKRTASAPRSEKNKMGELINKWSRSAFNFLLWIGFKPANVICFGRSIGTGPASYLAAALAEENIHVGGVVLHAPYITVHKIVQEYASLGTWLITNHWSNASNLEKMGASSCPLLIIHGVDDEVIPTDHGRQLFETYKGEKKDGFFPTDSSHNSYYIIDDLGKPMEVFLKEKSLALAAPSVRATIPAYMRLPPVWQFQPEQFAAAGAAAPSQASTAASATAAARAGVSETALDAQSAAMVQASLGTGVCGKAPEAATRTAQGAPGSVAAAAVHAVERSNSVLGNLIAGATGSKGGQWDVGLSHAPKELEKAEAGGLCAGSTRTSHFSRMIESGIFSRGSLEEIMGEALREVNREEPAETKKA
ncbi:hydrolase [Besnoitia besnoiti]|uniref:Hydrolase n=1 Tax=Besnoitia besnoiti TaxID=94643 RepID=A0A2A9MBG6_BESBE|nr:hydrolase [Besnoitia besnoiti]PFH33266.1 hydrolase [Besnoitia besnoiti]